MAMAATTQPIFVPSAGQKWSSPSGRSLLTMPPVNGSSRNLVVNNMHSHGLRLRTEPLPGKTRLFRTRSIKASTVSAGETVHGVQSLSISETFENLRKLGKVAFVPYITAGDPDLLTTAKALKVLDSCGSDIIELGVPYSDPLADGPVIQAAATRALQNGTNFDAVISMLREVIPQLTAPVVLFSYYNPILKRGLERFMHTIRYVGVRGLVIPDVPLEETETLRQITAANKIELVLLTTPTTPIERMKMIVEASKGFIYLSTTKPVAVGFGISTPEHVSQDQKVERPYFLHCT